MARRHTKHTKTVRVKVQRYLSRGLPDGRLQSLSKGDVIELPERVAASWIASGAAAKVESDAEVLVRAAKLLDVALVTTRQDVRDAAAEIGFPDVRAPE